MQIAQVCESLYNAQAKCLAAIQKESSHWKTICLTKTKFTLLIKCKKAALQNKSFFVDQIRRFQLARKLKWWNLVLYCSFWYFLLFSAVVYLCARGQRLNFFEFEWLIGRNGSSLFFLSGGEWGKTGEEQHGSSGSHLQVPEQGGGAQVQRELGEACGPRPLL